MTLFVWLRCVLVGSLIACVGYGQVEEKRGNQQTSAPNILLILFDDLGYQELGCTGQNARQDAGLPHIRTPRLDALAAQGLLFHQAYSADPVCAPTRCSLLTGRDQGHAVVRNNWEGDGRQGETWGPEAWEGQFPMPPETLTLSALLQQQGYVTGGFGKWGLGTPLDGGHPLDFGFDQWFGYLCQRQAHNFYPTHLWHNRNRVELDNPPFFAHQKFPENVDSENPENYQRYRGNEYSGDLVFEHARQFIEEQAQVEAPFFCYVPTSVPHLALQVPEEEPSLAEYRAEFAELDAPYLGQRGYVPNYSPRATYAAMITRADRQIGVLFDELEKQGVAENTIVIVMSDNGAATNGGIDASFFGSLEGLRGSKTHVWQGGLRVPMIVYWPGHTPVGGETDTVTVSQDILPTVVDILGLEEVESEGVSLVPTLQGREGDQQQPEYRYWELGLQQALLVGEWKAVQFWNRQKTEVQSLQLFHLPTDPQEEKNLAEQHPEMVEQMRELFVRAHTSPLMPQWAFGEEEKQEVQQLEYDPLAVWAER